jgi:hypothetical protein
VRAQFEILSLETREHRCAQQWLAIRQITRGLKGNLARPEPAHPVGDERRTLLLPSKNDAPDKERQTIEKPAQPPGDHKPETVHTSNPRDRLDSCRLKNVVGAGPRNPPRSPARNYREDNALKGPGIVITWY